MKKQRSEIMLIIKMADGNTVRWNPSEYTEYDFHGRFFVVIKNDQWIGMYATDQIVAVECRSIDR